MKCDTRRSWLSARVLLGALVIVLPVLNFIGGSCKAQTTASNDAAISGAGSLSISGPTQNLTLMNGGLDDITLTMNGNPRVGTTVNINLKIMNAILRADNLVISAKDVVNLNVPDGSAVLVMTTGTSSVKGSIISNGKVYFLNPGGLDIDSASRIQAAGFYANTMPYYPFPNNEQTVDAVFPRTLIGQKLFDFKEPFWSRPITLESPYRLSDDSLFLSLGSQSSSK